MDLFRKKPILEIADTESHLKKCLSAFDLTLLGIGAIIGAGIFVLTGIVAAVHSGPAITVSYILAGIACGFSALSYAELAASIGGCGSAYGYAYAGFGEIIAWIVGWDLILEYTLSVSTVSVGWAGYFKDLLTAMDIFLPVSIFSNSVHGGILNLLPCLIILLLSWLLIIGIRVSTRINNIMVIIKLLVILLFICVASSDFNIHNWTPYNPFGWSSVVTGASLIFFAYIGFDAVSTAAEEAINPQTDLPIGIIGSLMICTILYIIVAGLLTGIVPYNTLNTPSPISSALLTLGHHLVSGLIGVGAIAGLTTVMLALFYGLTRVFYAMARDGLLPKFFAATHIKTQTPVRIIGLMGFLMALIAAFIPMKELAELVNVGTLFAFIVVCSGVLYLRYKEPNLHRPFRAPLMPLTAILGICCCCYLIIYLPIITLLRFFIWMFIGIIIYFVFSRKHSTLAKRLE